MAKSENTELFQIVTAPYTGHCLLKLEESRASDDLTHAVITGAAWSGEGPVRAVVSAYSGGSKMMDCSFTHMGIPVLSTRARDFFDRWSGAELQYIQASIVGRTEEYFCMNVLSVDRDVLVGTPDLFRLENELQALIVRPNLVTRLMESNLVGPGLVSVVTGRSLFPGRPVP